MKNSGLRCIVSACALGLALASYSGSGLAGEDARDNAKPRVSYKTEDFSQDSDKVILARMLFGEARNCSDEEKAAIAYTVVNRAHDGKKWNGIDVKSAVLCKWQYSCFNANDTNRKKLMDPEKHDAKSWIRCLEVACDVLAGKYAEQNKGQTHYHTPAVSPNWKNSMKEVEFSGTRHRFYRKE